MTQTQPRKVGIWLRVSTDFQVNETDSLEHHEIRARAYCEAKDWEVVEVYKLSGVSGKSILQNAETQRMLSDIQSGHISALVFSKLARLARNTRELLDIAQVFQDHDAGLVSLQESIDTTTPAGRLFYTMLAATSTFEREEIASRVAASVPIRAKLGKSTGGQASFGYKWENNQLIPDENEAPVRKLMYELFDEYKRKKKVAEILNERGYRTRKGNKFNGTTVDRLLRDTTAKGMHRKNYTKSRGKGLQWDYKDQSDWVFVEIEPIISEELWNSCNDFLDAQRTKIRAAKGPTAKHLFAGLLKCRCGVKMYAYHSTTSYRCKDCKNKITMTVIEEIFESQLNEFLTSNADIDSVIDKTKSYVHSKQEELKALHNKRKEAISKMEHYEEMLIAGNISEKRFKEVHAPLDEMVRAADPAMEELKLDIEMMNLDGFTKENMIAKGQTLAESWKSLSKEKKRSLLEAITEEIIIDEDSVDISFTYAPFYNQRKKDTNQHGLHAATNKNFAG